MGERSHNTRRPPLLRDPVTTRAGALTPLGGRNPLIAQMDRDALTSNHAGQLSDSQIAGLRHHLLVRASGPCGLVVLGILFVAFGQPPASAHVVGALLVVWGTAMGARGAPPLLRDLRTRTCHHRLYFFRRQAAGYSFRLSSAPGGVLLKVPTLTGQAINGMFQQADEVGLIVYLTASGAIVNTEVRAVVAPEPAKAGPGAAGAYSWTPTVGPLEPLSAPQPISMPQPGRWPRVTRIHKLGPDGTSLVSSSGLFVEIAVNGPLVTETTHLHGSTARIENVITPQGLVASTADVPDRSAHSHHAVSAPGTLVYPAVATQGQTWTGSTVGTQTAADGSDRLAQRVSQVVGRCTVEHDVWPASSALVIEQTMVVRGFGDGVAPREIRAVIYIDIDTGIVVLSDVFAQPAPDTTAASGEAAPPASSDATAPTQR